MGWTEILNGHERPQTVVTIWSDILRTWQGTSHLVPQFPIPDKGVTGIHKLEEPFNTEHIGYYGCPITHPLTVKSVS